MAKFTPSAIISEISGSLAGTVFVNGSKSRQIRPRRSSKRKFNTKSRVRPVFASLASNWKSLTQAERSSFNAIAPQFPLTDRFGNQYAPSGFHLYISMNSYRDLVEQAISENAPAFKVSLPAYALSIDAIVSDLLIEWLPADLLSETLLQLLYATRPYSPGIEQVSLTDFKFIDRVAFTGVGSRSIQNAYEAVYGDISNQVGQKVSFMVRIYSASPSIPSARYFTTAVLQL